MKQITLFILLGLSLTSCVTATKGKLEEISGPVDKPKIEKNSKNPITIEYRFFINETIAGSEIAQISSGDMLKESVRKKVEQFQDSQIKVTAFNFGFDTVSMNGKDLTKAVSSLVDSTFPLKSDYIIRIELYKTYSQLESAGTLFLYTLWAPLHVLSLGLIPLTSNYEFNVKTTLMNREGKILQTVDTANEFRLWVWSPLIFWGGKSIYSDNFAEEVSAPAVSATVDHGIHELKFNH